MNNVDYSNLTNEAMADHALVVDLLNSLKVTYDWSRLPDFENPNSVESSKGLTGWFLLAGGIFIIGFCSCPGPCLGCYKFICCGAISRHFEHKHLAAEIKKAIKGGKTYAY